MRMSSSFPAIKHAIVAFSALHEMYLAGDAASSQTEVYSRQQYGRAIKSLHEHLSAASIHRDATEETLLTCLVFICFEILQGNDVAALVHLEAGLGIFSNLSSEHMTQSSNREQPSLSALAKIFIRLDNQATSLIGSRPPQSISPTNMHNLAIASMPCHSSPVMIAQARDTLHVCLSCVHDYLRSTAETIVPDKETSSLDVAIHERDRHLRSLQAWMHEFQDLLQRVYFSSANNNVELPTREEAKECAVLWLTYLVTFIKLSTALDPDEVAYDSYLPQFRAIIQHAEAVLESPTQDKTISNVAAVIPQRKRFTTEVNVIHPLYFTAFKCRHLPVRQRAVALMRIAGKEGAWDGVIFATIAEHVQDLEEDAIDDQYGEEGPPFGVSESKRVHSVGFDVRREKRNVWVQFRRRVFTAPFQDGVPAWDELEAVLSY